MSSIMAAFRQTANKSAILAIPAAAPQRARGAARAGQRGDHSATAASPSPAAAPNAARVRRRHRHWGPA
ncbi:hypothetical protein, partial [Xanthomonas translucens]|uniref:hypothetical protein n=1 Tax=Xanthomonas campestris pv. translucens TaxID=343 RepID=UPI001CA3E858